MLSAVALVTNSGPSSLTIALIALGGVLSGGLLGYVGKSRELRLLTLVELRRLYAEFLAAHAVMELTETRYGEAGAADKAHWDALDIGDEDDWQMLTPGVREVSNRLSTKKGEARARFMDESRRFTVALAQMEIQAPRDTFEAAAIFAGGSRYKNERVSESYGMFIELARRDLTPSRLMWGLREIKAWKSQRVDWWRESDL